MCFSFRPSNMFTGSNVHLLAVKYRLYTDDCKFVNESLKLSEVSCGCLETSKVVNCFKNLNAVLLKPSMKFASKF